MTCVQLEDKKIMAFLNNSKTNKLNEEERKEFAEELKLFQRGSAYRKTHPIVYSRKDEIKQEIAKLNKELNEIEKEEKSHLALEFHAKYNSDKDLKLFRKRLNVLLNNEKYMIKKYTFNNSYEQLVIYDVKQRRPVETILPYSKCTIPLTHEEIKEVYKGGK